MSGECSKNHSYMKEYCPKSCGYCGCDKSKKINANTRVFVGVEGENWVLSNGVPTGEVIICKTLFNIKTFILCLYVTSIPSDKVSYFGILYLHLYVAYLTY